MCPPVAFSMSETYLQTYCSLQLSYLHGAVLVLSTAAAAASAATATTATAAATIPGLVIANITIFIAATLVVIGSVIPGPQFEVSIMGSCKQGCT